MPNYAIDINWTTVQEAANDEQAIELAQRLTWALTSILEDEVDGAAELLSVERVDGGPIYPPEQ